MKNLEKLLVEKLNQIKNEEKGSIDKIDNGIKRREEEIVQKKESELNVRIKSSLEQTGIGALIGGGFGIVLGAFLGFGKGCSEYTHQHKSLLQPFWYIPESILTFCIICAIIGAFFGLIKAQFSDN